MKRIFFNILSKGTWFRYGDERVYQFEELHSIFPPQQFVLWAGQIWHTYGFNVERLIYDIDKFNRQYTFVSLKHDDQLLYEKLVDFLGANLDYFMTYKEFIEWFFFKDMFQIMHDGNTNFHANVEKTISGF